MCNDQESNFKSITECKGLQRSHVSITAERNDVTLFPSIQLSYINSVQFCGMIFTIILSNANHFNGIIFIHVVYQYRRLKNSHCRRVKILLDIPPLKNLYTEEEVIKTHPGLSLWSILTHRLGSRSSGWRRTGSRHWACAQCWDWKENEKSFSLTKRCLALYRSFLQQQ